MDRNEPSLTLDGFIKADLGTAEAIDTAVAQLPAQVDALCNIAGVPGTADGELVARVNYLGLRHLTEKVLARMASNELPKQYEVQPPIPRSFFSAESLSSEGAR